MHRQSLHAGKCRGYCHEAPHPIRRAFVYATGRNRQEAEEDLVAMPGVLPNAIEHVYENLKKCMRVANGDEPEESLRSF